MFKKFKFTDKTLLIPLTFSVILVIIVFVIVIITISGNKITTKGTTPPPLLPSSNASISHIIPDEPQVLTAGVPHTFLVYFNQDVSITNYNVFLYAVDITQASPVPVLTQISVEKFSPQVIVVRTKDPIEERREYDLIITDVHTDKAISTTSYLSGEVQPTKIPTNNQTLKNYLPHETNSYLLEYSPEKNLYIFHFKYDPANPDDINTQLQDAKSQANQFIQSKGVDLNSIVVEYRSS